MFRIIDCNINRVCEGLRVIEDIARFKFNSIHISRELKKLRHKVRTLSMDFDLNIIIYRDTTDDIGPEVDETLRIVRKHTTQSLISANFKRVQEGLRSLEETTQNREFESIRYSSYQLEKSFFELLNKKVFDLPNLYGITYSKESQGRSNINVVKEMIKGGIKLIQYREKELSIKDMLRECREIRIITKKSNVLFIINDHIDIALITDADGVHIGQDDLPISEVRKIIGNKKIIGLSTHNKQQAINASNDGADYIGVGPILSTNTKVNVCDPVGYSYLEWVVKNIKIPFVAIGGIKEHNIDEILSRGAKSIALVSEITGNKNIPGKIERLNKIIMEYKNEI